MIGRLLGRDVPACGFSLGLERIIVVMTERDMFPPKLRSGVADVMVTQWSAARVGEALALARELRAGGLRVEVFPEAEKLGKQFRYAASRGTRFVVVEGDDERARGELAMKNMVTGEQVTLPRADAVTWIRARVTA
jgi:histidyl-tRNA synthetase